MSYQICTRITSGSLNASFNSNTIGSLYTTGGNIGIGTTSPGYALDVSGGLNVSGNITMGNIPLNQTVSKLGNLGLTVTMDNLLITLPSTGNNSVQMATISGTYNNTLIYSYYIPTGNSGGTSTMPNSSSLCNS